MYGDFSRVTFQRDRFYTSVLKQQGRVELDADSNENTAILLDTIRLLAADMIGRHGSPDTGFVVEKSGQNLKITPGIYYVDGFRIESFPRADKTDLTFANQPYMYFEEGDDARNIPLETPMIIYLKVWEQARSAVEDPSIREKALGIYGPDTCLRTRLIWQIRWVEVVFGEADEENLDQVTGLPAPPANVN